jgi:hypothetical protein
VLSRISAMSSACALDAALFPDRLFGLLCYEANNHRDQNQKSTHTPLYDRSF